METIKKPSQKVAEKTANRVLNEQKNKNDKFQKNIKNNY